MNLFRKKGTKSPQQFSQSKIDCKSLISFLSDIHMMLIDNIARKQRMYELLIYDHMFRFYKMKESSLIISRLPASIKVLFYKYFVESLQKNHNTLKKLIYLMPNPETYQIEHLRNRLDTLKI
jgi:hypothetical protein